MTRRSRSRAAEPDEQRAGRVRASDEQPVDVPRAASVGACGPGSPSRVSRWASTSSRVIHASRRPPAPAVRASAALPTVAPDNADASARRMSVARPTVSRTQQRGRAPSPRPRRGPTPTGVTSWIDTEQADVDAAAELLRRTVRLDLQPRRPRRACRSATSSPSSTGGTSAASAARRTAATSGPAGVAAGARWNTYVAVTTPRRPRGGSRRPAARSSSRRRPRARVAGRSSSATRRGSSCASGRPSAGSGSQVTNVPGCVELQRPAPRRARRRAAVLRPAPSAGSSPTSASRR